MERRPSDKSSYCTGLEHSLRAGLQSQSEVLQSPRASRRNRNSIIPSRDIGEIQEVFNLRDHPFAVQCIRKPFKPLRNVSLNNQSRHFSVAGAIYCIYWNALFGNVQFNHLSWCQLQQWCCQLRAALPNKPIIDQLWVNTLHCAICASEWIGKQIAPQSSIVLLV